MHPRSRLLARFWLPLGLAGLAFALRVTGLTAQSLWRDEVDTLMFATRPLSEALQMFRQPGQNGPLFFLLMRPWLALAGHSEFALRFPSALAGALAVPLGHGLVMRLAGRTPAALTAVLLAAAPYLTWYGQEAKMYAALIVLALVALWLTLDVTRRGGLWRWFLLYGITTAAIYMHILAALLVPVQFLWLVILPGEGRAAPRWRSAAGYLAALSLPYLPLALWQADMLLSRFMTGHRFVPLDDVFRVLAAVFSLGVLPGQSFLKLLPFMVALVAGCVLWPLQERAHNGARRVSAGRLVALLAIWLLLPVLVTYAVSLWTPVFTERYLIWTMPAFLGVMSLGMVALARVWRPLGTLVLAVILTLSLNGVVAQARQPVKADVRAAAGYVARLKQPGDLLIYQIPYIRYTFTYYSSGRADPLDAAATWLDGPYTNLGMTEAEVDTWMSTGIGDAPAVWLIASEAAMWDARGLAEKWLAVHGVVDVEASFTRVAATRYILQKP